MSKIKKNPWKLMKITNIEKEISCIIWTINGNLNEIFRKDVTLFLEDTLFEKPQGGGGQIYPPPPSRFWVKVAWGLHLVKSDSPAHIVSTSKLSCYIT